MNKLPDKKKMQKLYNSLSLEQDPQKDTFDPSLPLKGCILVS